MPTNRRRVCLELNLDELHDALTVAGYRTADGSRLTAVVHDLDRAVVRIVVDGPQYPLVEPGCEPPRFRAADVRCGLRVVAEQAAAAVDMLLVPKPTPKQPGPPDAGVGRLEGDGGIGVGCAVST